MTDEKLRELHRYESATVFSEEERIVLRLADAMATTPAHVSEELFASLRRTFSERQIVELASAIAWENYRARFNRVFDIEAEDYSHGAFCPVPMRDT